VGRAMILITAAVLVHGVSVAAVIRVPGEVAGIEEALTIAAPYDTILVAPGTYHVNLVWPVTDGLKLESEAGPESTILDGSGDVQVIGIYSGVDTTTVVRGFTIRNGHAEGQ